MQIDLIDTEAPQIRALISAQLHAHNAARLGMAHGASTWAVLLRDAAGQVEGGLWAQVRFGWMTLEWAFLPPERRGSGVGAAALAALEAQAFALGCRGMRVGSYSFQAPGFYVRRGYTLYATLDDDPPGHSLSHLYKPRADLAQDASGIAVTPDPDPADRARLRELLLAHDAAFVPPPDFHALSAVLRDDAGEVIGGLVGYTGHRWFTVEQFALPEAARGSGFGTRLLGLAHAQAQARGAVGAKLATASYQARPFYERLGYRAYGEIPDYQPGGHSRFQMALRFPPGLS